MSFNAGSIESKLTLDRTSWTRDLRKTLKEIDDLERRTATVGIDADDDNFKVVYDNVESLLLHLEEQVTTPSIDLDIGKIEAQIEEIEARLDALSGTRREVSIDAEITGVTEVVAEIEAVEAAAEFIARDPLGIELEIDGLPEAYAEIDAFMAFTDAIEEDRLTLGVDVDAGKALSELAAIEAAASRLDGDDINMRFHAGGLSELIEPNGGSMGLLKMLIVALIALAPVMSAAISAATAELLGFVGALVAAAGPALILAGGLFLLIKRWKDAKKAGDEMSGPMAAFNDSLDYLNDILDKLIPKIEDSGFNLMSQGIHMVADILPFLVPIFNDTADMISRVLTQINKWGKGGGFQAIADFFGGFGISMLHRFINIFGSLLGFFGKLFVGMEPFIRDMMDDLDGLTASWSKWAGELGENDKFQEWLQNAAELGPKVWDMLWSLVKAFMNLGAAMEPLAGPMIEGLTTFFNFIANMDTSQLTILVTIFGALFIGFQVIGPILIGLISVFETLITIIGVLVSPVGLVILAIVALIAIIIYLYKTNEEVRDAINSTWASIRDNVLPIIMQIVDAIRENWPQIKEMALEIWGSLKDIIISAIVIISIQIKTFVAVISAIWRAWGDTIMKVASAGFKFTIGVISGALKVIQGLMKVFKGVFTGDWQEIWDGLKTIAQGGKQILVSVFQNLKDAVVAIFSKLGGEIADAFRGAINAVIGGWNSLSFSIPGFDPPGPGPKFPGLTIGTPDIPLLAKGGLAYAPTVAVVGDNPGPEPEVIQPLSALEDLLDRRSSAAQPDYGTLVAALAGAFRQVLSESGGMGRGGVSAEDLERLIRAASVNLNVESPAAGGSVMEWVTSLLFELRRLGYRGGVVPVGGY